MSIRRWLSKAPPALFTLYAMGAAFSAYFCMYAFRKPFAVATYEGQYGDSDLELKILFITAQVIGYAISKLAGIKVVSEMTRAKRALTIVACIAVAELALVAFAVLPVHLKPLALLANGLPLGMIWGLVYGFLEGRRLSDLLGAGLCASFIIASGFVKSLGKALLEAGVPEYWMAAAVGGIFLLPMLGFVLLLAQVPPPDAQDVAERSERAPMDGPARRAFLVKYAPGLVALVLGYVLLTAYRDFRDNFAREIWDALGYAADPEIMTTAELPVAFGSLLAVAAIFRFKDNRRALAMVHLIMIFGALLTLGSTLAFQLGWLGPAPWMICVGLGLYLGYVPFNCVLFDRLVAGLGAVATAGFLIYVADSAGYVGSVGLLLYKNFGQPDLSWLEFFKAFSLLTGVVTLVLYGLSAVYFHRQTAPAEQAVKLS